MVVACQLVNLTTWQAARPAFEWLRGRYVTPGVLAKAKPSDLHDALRPLGLWRKRAITLVRLANAWLSSPPTDAKSVSKLPGCGKYASDTWAIFVDRRSDVQATDGKLLWYLEELRDERPVPLRGGVQHRGDRPQAG
jgi:endonuclease III